MRRFVLPALFFLLLAPHTLLAQVVVSGTVTDQNGSPLPGVNVFFQDFNLGATTDVGGRYSFDIPARYVRNQEAVLSARFVGYREGEQTVQLTDGPLTVDFTLSETSLSLEEVVVTGVIDPVAGKKLPWAASKLTPEDLAVPSTNSALGVIQGKVAGVSIVRPSGQPGTGVNILLRSPTSVTRSNSPLIVVDGVILGSSFGSTTVDLESLDIQDIEVIKGAAAASLYGSRAAAGVISIRTARGSLLGQGETRVRVRSELGRSSVPPNINLAETHPYKIDAEGRFVDENGRPIRQQRDESLRVIDDDRIMDNPYLGPLYDNIEAFFQPGRFALNTVSVSHNARTTNFLASYSRYDEAGALANNDGFQRNSFRLNLDHFIRDDLTIAASAYHSRGHRDELSGDPFFELLAYSPEVNLGLTDSLGEYLQQPDPQVPFENPLWRQSSRDNYEDRIRTLANGQIRFTPLRWFNLLGTFSYDRSDLNSQVYVPKGTILDLVNDGRSDGQLTKISQFTDTFNGSLSANLAWRFGDLNTRLMTQGSFEQESSTIIGAQGTDLYVSGVPDLDVAETREVTSDAQEIRSNGWLTDLSLDYGGKYIGSFLVRRDGSSLFGSEERWNTYYRAAVAYRVSEEPWWPFKATITEFKPRFSRGTAGGRPSFSDQYETWSVASNGAVSKGNLGNRFIRPELTTEQEMGLDMIFVNRLSFQLTYATQITEGLLLQLPQRAATGYFAQWANIGTQEGRTFEASVEAELARSQTFSWSATLVADRSRHEMVEWDRPPYTNSLRLFDQDASLGDMWGQKFIRSLDDLPAIHANSANQFQLNDDGYVVPVGLDVNGNPHSWQNGINRDLWGTTVTIDGVNYRWGHPVVELDEDGFPGYLRIGRSDPDLSLGLLQNVRWRNVSFYAHLHAQIGGQVYNQTRQFLYALVRHGDLDQSGKPDEAKKEFDYYATGLYNAGNFMDEFVEDASFLKLRELAVTYSVTRSQLARLGLGAYMPERINISLIGRNLFTLTNYSGFDPEVGTVLLRADSFTYPNTRTLTGSIEITF